MRAALRRQRMWWKILGDAHAATKAGAMEWQNTGQTSTSFTGPLPTGYRLEIDSYGFARLHGPVFPSKVDEIQCVLTLLSPMGSRLKRLYVRVSRPRAVRVQEELAKAAGAELSN